MDNDKNQETYLTDIDEQKQEKQRLEGDYYEKQILNGIKKGDVKLVQDSIDRKPSTINYFDKRKNWTPLVWAATKNQIDIVRLLIQKGGHNFYLNKQDKQQAINPKKCTLGFINSQIKPTPLQWACFKGNIQVVWILLKTGFDWRDVDQFGNNCVHLAASGGNSQIFECLMMYGVEINAKNARNHTVYDLATTKEILKLINNYQKTSSCQKCGKELQEIKFWCQKCLKFFCNSCVKIEWVKENATSKYNDRLDGKCLNCWDFIALHTEELKKIMEQQNQVLLTEKLIEIDQKQIQIDLKLHNDALIQEEKLITQNQIIEYLKSLEKVDNYKTILKSVSIIKEMKADALARNIKLDNDIIKITEDERDRLVAERNLRFELDSLDIGDCSVEQVQKLQYLVSEAKNHQTKEILKNFKEYPIRLDYTQPIEWDAKARKPFDPETKKIVDIKVLLDGKWKKKKNKTKFVVPAWAINVDEFGRQIKVLEDLLKQSEQLELHKEFIQECNENISRMKKEHKHRLLLQKEELLIQELRSGQKKKK